MALYELGRDERYQVVSLLTTVAAGYGRISHHGVRTELLERQAMAVGVPLNVIELPGESVTNEEYEALMTRAMLAYADGGISTVAFGDIFLQDLRDYREKNLAPPRWACGPSCCSAPGSLDTSLSHAAGLIEIAACHA